MAPDGIDDTQDVEDVDVPDPTGADPRVCRQHWHHEHGALC